MVGPNSKRTAAGVSTGDSGTTGNPIVRRVLDFIRERGLEPGQRLPAERALAELLGVSRNALREGLATLVSLRAVEARPNSGIYVRSLAGESSFETLVVLSDSGALPTATEVKESMEVRAPLERQSIELACARRTRADLAALRRVLDDTDAVISARGNIADCDQAFHLALVGAAHNSVLTRVLNAFYQLSLPRRRAFFADTRRGAESAAEHRAIVEAVEQRDPGLGAALMERHLGNARVYWRDVLAPAPALKTSSDPARLSRGRLVSARD